MKIYSELAKKIKQLRLDNNLTVEEAAQNFGILPSTYVKYENGSAKIPIHRFVFICAYYKTSADELLDIKLDKDSLAHPNGKGLGEKLINLRIENHKTVKEVAEYLGITEEDYIKYRDSQKVLQILYLVELCQLYNVSADELLGLADLSKEI